MGVFEFGTTSPLLLDLLYLDGPLITVSISAPTKLLRVLREAGAPPYASFEGLALIDTGASTSAVDVSVFTTLDIPVIDSAMVQTAHGTAELELYNASASFPELNLRELPLARALGGHMRAPTESGTDLIMLIGRDILRDWRFSYDGPTGHFRIEV